MDLEFLETIRLTELKIVLDLLKSKNPAPQTILEIGAGTGWQAKRLAEEGYTPEAIEVRDNTSYTAHRVWPIIEYDGRNIPFADASFDVVFSSNVMEHIPHVVEFQTEIKRVLKPDGIAIHLVPSAGWRFWTTLAHYLFLVKFAVNAFNRKVMGGKPPNPGHPEATDATRSSRKSSAFDLIKKAAVPPRHGEIGTALTELYYFSGRRWSRLFKATGWNVALHQSNGLFYTGYMLFGRQVSISARRLLSHALGGSCHVYMLQNGSRTAKSAARL